MHRLAAGKLHRLLLVDLDLAFGLVTLDGEVLQLTAIGRLRIEFSRWRRACLSSSVLAGTEDA
jgi:hypothetical protein